jgi:hypothetical protein
MLSSKEHWKATMLSEHQGVQRRWEHQRVLAQLVQHLNAAATMSLSIGHRPMTSSGSTSSCFTAALYNGRGIVKEKSCVGCKFDFLL